MAVEAGHADVHPLNVGLERGGFHHPFSGRSATLRRFYCRHRFHALRTLRDERTPRWA